MTTSPSFLAAAIWLLACCPREHPTTPSLKAPAEPDVPGFSLDRPPMLAIARHERLAARPRPLVKPPPVHDTEPSHVGEEIDGTTTITREVVVRRRGLATAEDLAGYLVRAMDKTPNGLHPTRALARIRGPVRCCPTDSAAEGRQARRIARATVVFARTDLERCYAQRLARDPRVIVKQPVGLVLEQAHRLDIAEIEIDVDLRVADGRARVTGVHARDAVLYEEDVACITDALGGTNESTEGIDTQVGVVLWTQPEDRPDGEPNPAAGLSLAAAAFGWMELQRDAGDEALQLFEDAAWLYRLPEYQVLVGLAHERLGHRREAQRAYQAYLDGRPGAPDADEIEARVRRL